MGLKLTILLKFTYNHHPPHTLTAATVTGAAFWVQTKSIYMNNYKVGQRVKVITASTGTELNVNGWTGEIIEVQSDNFVGIRFENYPLLYCFTDDGISLDLEVIPTPKWLPIDKDNLYPDKVVVMNIIQPKQIFTGTLELNRYDDITLYIGNGQYLSNFTHYIPLTDLLNLPIAK